LDQDVTVGVVIKNTGDLIKRSWKIYTDLREIDLPFKWAFWDRLLTPTGTLNIEAEANESRANSSFFFTALGCTYALMPK